MIRGKLDGVLRHPWLTGINLLARHWPQWFLQHYARLAQRQGLGKAYLLLSLDCDTDDDAAVAEQVHQHLCELGVTPIYAVPGRNLERNAQIYRRIAATGSEFVNHGYEEHAYWDEQARRYRSRFFYDRLSSEQIVRDIQQGHEVHLKVLGKPPSGFRAPHFGTYQQPAQLRFLHRALCELGYHYSSSTTPYYGFRHGPLHRLSNGLMEIPVSGCFDSPLSILDSWGFFAAPERRTTGQDYQEEFRKMVDFFADDGHAGLLNFYADPSHIAGHPGFFEAVRYAIQQVAVINSYRELLTQHG